MAELNGVLVENPVVSMEATGKGDCCHNELNAPGAPVPEEMTAKDYYFDSYAHFGIHEVSCLLNISFCNLDYLEVKVCEDEVWQLNKKHTLGKIGTASPSVTVYEVSSTLSVTVSVSVSSTSCDSDYECHQHHL